jgi:hypothetical protein
MSSEEAKAIALGNLIGELDIASEITLGQRLVPGRIIEGYHGDIASGLRVPEHLKYPGEKGGKRMSGKRMSGGGICEDNIYVRLAIDSAIILASAAVVVGVGYAGFATLQAFMNVYALSPATIAIIESLYNSLIATGGAILTSLYNVGSSAVSIGQSFGTVATTVARGMYASAGPVLNAFARAAPAIAAGRYIGTNRNAYEDAKNILTTLDAQYKAITSYTGAITRSMTDKKTNIERQLASAQETLKSTYETVKSGAESSASKSSSLYLAIRTKICQLIDRGVEAVDITAGLEEALATINFEGGRRRRRTRKHKRSMKPAFKKGGVKSSKRKHSKRTTKHRK